MDGLMVDYAHFGLKVIPQNIMRILGPGFTFQVTLKGVRVMSCDAFYSEDAARRAGETFLIKVLHDVG